MKVCSINVTPSTPKPSLTDLSVDVKMIKFMGKEKFNKLMLFCIKTRQSIFANKS